MCLFLPLMVCSFMIRNQQHVGDPQLMFYGCSTAWIYEALIRNETQQTLQFIVCTISKVKVVTIFALQYLHKLLMKV